MYFFHQVQKPVCVWQDNPRDAAAPRLDGGHQSLHLVGEGTQQANLFRRASVRRQVLHDVMGRQAEMFGYLPERLDRHPHLESMSKLAYGPVKGLKSASADF